MKEKKLVFRKQNVLYERKISRCREKGVCPECRGRGLEKVLQNEYYYVEPSKCAGCQGTGKFTDWNRLKVIS
ncbi:methionine aminopeptidase [Alkalicoccus saliphilus]|jgi:DnaJ-class molecular chaperone|uniref:Methionine aminopeptidase n=1 Tax=Alkalicoccus saliphilus TaxID=200989 RepID=A0A2T4U9S8_9BACI|nr:methionine aminopeptidase [Alkalicoccus saliphilus]PTL40152.1 methionine aminopeptidase [Alkalicoccus saliphilus]